MFTHTYVYSKSDTKETNGNKINPIVLRMSKDKNILEKRVIAAPDIIGIEHPETLPVNLVIEIAPFNTSGPFHKRGLPLIPAWISN